MASFTIVCLALNGPGVNKRGSPVAVKAGWHLNFFLLATPPFPNRAKRDFREHYLAYGPQATPLSGAFPERKKISIIIQRKKSIAIKRNLCRLRRFVKLQAIGQNSRPSARLGHDKLGLLSTV